MVIRNWKKRKIILLKLITIEEDKFNKTIDQGLAILNEYQEQLEKKNVKILIGRRCI